MTDWNSAQYLKFKDERTQPAVDLAGRLKVPGARKIADIGCGPGNSTRVVKTFFPQARVIGFDNSENMLAKARREHPELEFQFCDAAVGLPGLEREFDVVFSNACLQWLPDHRKRIPELLAMLKEGGTLAVQIPMNDQEPVSGIIRELVRSPNWRGLLEDVRTFAVLRPEDYYEILVEHASSFDLWQTTYLHVLPSPEAILEWFRSTGLKPYLERLAEEKKTEFEAAFLEGVRRAYPLQKDGRVIFRFPRFFFTALR